MERIGIRHKNVMMQADGKFMLPVLNRFPPVCFNLNISETHVWRAELDAPSWYVRELESILSQDEHIRASRFVFRRERERYIVGRGQLRMLLGRYVGKSPAALRFSYGACGKPDLEDVGTNDLFFNVAHAHGLVLYAVTRGQHVGVDVERVAAAAAYDEVARRFFSPHEYRALRTLPLAIRSHAFFRCWVPKEAYLKGLGTGLSIAPNSFDVAVDPRMPVALVRHPENLDDSSRWALYDLRLDPRHVAALAVRGYVHTLRIRRWPAAW